MMRRQDDSLRLPFIRLSFASFGRLSRAAFLLGLTILALGNPTRASGVTLSWDPSPDPTVVGYAVYYGLADRGDRVRRTTRDRTLLEIDGLTPGASYVFTVAAYNNAKIESLFSNQLLYTAPNEAPSALPKSVKLRAGSSVALELQGDDPEERPLSFEIVEWPKQGKLLGTPPYLTYSSDSGFTGDDSLRFRVSDGYATSPPAKVDLVVEQANRAPIVTDDVVAPTRDRFQLIYFQTLLANDTDPDGDALRVASVSPTSQRGAAVYLWRTSIAYAGENIFEDDSIEYVVTDGFSGQAKATIFITDTRPESPHGGGTPGPKPPRPPRMLPLKRLDASTVLIRCLGSAGFPFILEARSLDSTAEWSSFLEGTFSSDGSFDLHLPVDRASSIFRVRSLTAH